jgi:putative membrane protein
LKTKSEAVKKLTASILANYNLAEQKRSSLTLKAADSQLSNQVGMDGSDARRKLDAASGADFDRVFVATQIDAHRKLLDVLDRQLVPNAKNAELKALLLRARPKVEEQLRTLESAQKSLGAAGQTNAK